MAPTPAPIAVPTPGRIIVPIAAPPAAPPTAKQSIRLLTHTDCMSHVS